MPKDIYINSIILSIGILLGRLSGYIREMVIATKYGASSQSDEIILMLSVPDLLNNLLASGAVVGILIPMLTSTKGELERVLNEFTRKLLLLSVVFYVISIGVIFFIYEFYFFGLLSISLLSIFPNIFTFIISGYLQFKKRFKKQALNNLVFNTVIILFLLLNSGSWFFAFGILIAGVVRTIWVKSDLKAISLRKLISNDEQRTNLLNYKTLFFMICANGLMFINPMIDKIFASFLSDGSVAILSYAEKIYLLPVSVFLTTYAVAMFPDLSKLVANGDIADLKKLLKKSIGVNLLLSLCIGFVVFYLSAEIVEFFFKIANLNISTIEHISEVLKGYIIILILAGTNSILLNIIFAYKWYNSLIIYAILLISLKIIMNYIIVSHELDIKFIAYGTSIIGMLSTVYLFGIYLLKRKKHKN